MAIKPANINSITIMHSNDPEILVCKCGYEPSIGDEFYYKSIYSDEPTIGIVARVDKRYIYSKNGTRYRKNEIEVKPKHILREEKLNYLGI